MSEQDTMSLDQIADFAVEHTDLLEGNVEAFRAWVDNFHSGELDLSSIRAEAQTYYENGDNTSVEEVVQTDLETLIGEWVEEFTEQYRGEWESLADYAKEFLDDTGALAGLSGDLKGYFDYEAYGRDLELGGDVWTADGGVGVHIFEN